VPTANKKPPRWTALVIEPDRARSDMLRDLLRDIGCAEIFVLREPDSGLGFLEQRNPRIVLCAAQMEPVDGFAFTRKFRRDPKARSNETSVVLTFAGVGRNDVLSALNAGADAILSFPMSRAQLSTMLGLLDTQKRTFVRSATYVGPCRRRGLVSADAGRRLEDFGAPEALGEMMATLKALFERSQRNPISVTEVEASAAKLADFLRAARQGRVLDEDALALQCKALVRQFADHAPGQKSFDHAFSPLRKLLTNVVLKDVKQLKPETAAAA
jgi:CheY-like chemotaxis protein